MRDPFHDRIEEFLDGALSPEERDGVAAHLEGCDECRAEVEESRRLRRLALASPPVGIPEDLGARIRARVEERARAGRRTPLLSIRSPAAWLTAAAAVFLAVLLLRPPPPPERLDRPPPRAASPADADPGAALDDWLVQAGNAGPGDAALLAAEARELGLLGRVRGSIPGARGEALLRLRRAEDFLVQLLNDPSADELPAEAGLVARLR